jgi:hypothetical protein
MDKQLQRLRRGSVTIPSGASDITSHEQALAESTDHTMTQIIAALSFAWGEKEEWAPPRVSQTHRATVSFHCPQVLRVEPFEPTVVSVGTQR